MLRVPSEDVEFPEKLNVHDKEFLYAPGKNLEIFSHQPPTLPFDKIDRVDQDTLRARSPREHVFLKTPSERVAGSRRPSGESPYFGQEDSATLRILENLDVGDGTGAQVVLCDFETADRQIHKPTAYWNKMGHNIIPNRVVAKIYDPLLQVKVNQLAPHIRVDVVDKADGQYANEAAAYAELHEAAKTKPMIQDFAPRFYGTWTTMIKNARWGQSDTRPSDANDILHERPVRIILMEYIRGISIRDTCTTRWKGSIGTILIPPTGDENQFKDQARRKDVFARILHGLVSLDHIGILTGSLWFKAASFIIENPVGALYHQNRKTLGSKIRVVMVGYSGALVTRYRNSGLSEDEHFPRPRHPACSQYTPAKLSCLAGWYPLEWVDQDDDEMFRRWVDDDKVFDKKIFTCKEEIDAITDRLEEEWYSSEKCLEPPKLDTLKLLGLASPEPCEEAKRNIESVKRKIQSAEQSSGSAKDPLKSQKIRDLTTKDSGSGSASDYLSSSEADLASSMATLTTRRTSSSHSTNTSGHIGPLIANEPTAKDAGRKAVAGGITTVTETEVGEEGDKGHEADDEGSPNSKSGKAAETGEADEEKGKGKRTE